MHHHLRRNGQLVAVLTNDDHRLTPELAARGEDDEDVRALSTLCLALLDMKSMTGEFVPSGIGMNRR
jgi:hypothetical protein